LQQEGRQWKATYPEKSATGLLWKYIFQLGIWGEIECSANNVVVRKVKRHYERKGNHISKAGWPVITDFSGEYFTAVVYSLGCCLVKKEWLLRSPFDEVLDRHGIGDNYGVIMGFPGPGIRVLNNTCVYHHQEPANRLQKPLQYYRRALALHYFIKTRPSLSQVKTRWLLWSLIGNLLRFTFSESWMMIRAAFESIWTIVSGQNPYCRAAKKGRTVVEATL